jgi:hypothetical protein
MDTSIFKDKSKVPTDTELKKILGKNIVLWNDIKKYVNKKFPAAEEMWNYSGKTLGWGFRLKDSKRVIVYLTPFDGTFNVSFVYGSKAAEEAMISKVSEDIKNTIRSAKVYAEGRGFRVKVKNKKIIKDVKLLIDIKLSN